MIRIRFFRFVLPKSRRIPCRSFRLYSFHIVGVHTYQNGSLSHPANSRGTQKGPFFPLNSPLVCRYPFQCCERNCVWFHFESRSLSTKDPYVGEWGFCKGILWYDLFRKNMKGLFFSLQFTCSTVTLLRFTTRLDYEFLCRCFLCECKCLFNNKTCLLGRKYKDVNGKGICWVFWGEMDGFCGLKRVIY